MGSIYSLPRKCTLSTKLRNFQFKFIHRRIATNVFYLRFKPQILVSVALVKEPKERLFTFFWDCPVTRGFWNDVKDFLVSRVDLMEVSGVLRKIKCLGLKGKMEIF